MPYDTAPTKSEKGIGMTIFWFVVVVIILGAIITVPWVCAGNTAVSPMDKYTLVYQGGPLDGRSFIKMVPPGQGRFWKGNLNDTYEYPSTQRTYIISMKEDVGDRPSADQLIVNCIGGNKVYLEVALAFKVVPDKLQQFHEMLGLKYGAWNDNGWDLMLEEQVRQPLETAFQEEAKGYTNIQACNEEGMTQMGDAVAAVIQSRIDNYMNGHYIQVLSLSLTKATPDGTVQTEIEKIAAAKQAIETAKNNLEAAKKTAEANKILQESLKGEGGMTAIMQKAVEKGLVTFWVVNGQDLTVTGPTTP
jgi:regulator of protease activity HflC (stomatin/prohibitin superfamily)